MKRKDWIVFALNKDEKEFAPLNIIEAETRNDALAKTMDSLKSETDFKPSEWTDYEAFPMELEQRFGAYLRFWLVCSGWSEKQAFFDIARFFTWMRINLQP